MRYVNEPSMGPGSGNPARRMSQQGCAGEVTRRFRPEDCLYPEMNLVEDKYLIQRLALLHLLDDATEHDGSK